MENRIRCMVKWKIPWLPCEAAISSTWNPDLIEQAGKSSGRGNVSSTVSRCCGTGIKWKKISSGRQETLNTIQDPYVSGTMATLFIKGLQSRGVGACIKHFTLNEQKRATSCRSHGDERTKREIYYRPFEMAIKMQTMAS